VNDTAKIIEHLARIADGMDKLVAAIPKPASRTRRVVEIAVTAVTIAGILSAIDTILSWIRRLVNVNGHFDNTDYCYSGAFCCGDLFVVCAQRIEKAWFVERIL
jgi:hypothetical protein